MPSLRPESRAARTLRELLQTGRPLSFVRTSEEERVGRILAEIAPAVGNPPVWTWSVTNGLRAPGANAAAAGSESPEATLAFLAQHTAPGIFHLKDFHEPMRDSAVVRRGLRDLHALCGSRGQFVVVTAPVRSIPEDLERAIVYVELRVPDSVEIAAFVRDETRALPHPPSDETIAALAPALLGLTLEETRYALRRALAAAPELTADSRKLLLQEKRALVSGGGMLEFVTTPVSMEDIGGLQNLKQWLRERRKLFDLRESLSKDIVPKGLLLMGIPGCGKSLCVKAISSLFELPLYRMDMMEVFSGRHGNPGTAFADACRQMEELAPAVLWFDEIEMAVTSTESAGEQGRIFAFFLTWMQEKAPGLFVAATANRIDLLPAEMIRKGRFDEVFFVDLPNDDERSDIFRIHLSRRGYDPDSLGIPDLIGFTQGWTAAEVEQCVVSAITQAKLAEREVTPQDLLTLAARSVPLSRAMREQINHIRSWAFERAIRATPQTRLGK